MPRAGRHRNLSPLQRFLARASSVIVVIAALGAGNLVLKLTPDTDGRERPFLAGGEQGDTVDADRFKATLVQVRTAAVVKVSNATHDTQGVWVILRVRFESQEEPLAIAYAALVDSQDRSFFATDRIRQPLVDGSRILQPGIRVEGDVAFEVPHDAVGLTAQFATAVVDRRMQAVTDISLPLGSGVWLNREPAAIEPIEVNP
ncbi:MAG TPA: hypothetical protein VF062_17615 [Candidatus Limnocylindrales bacterium]